MTEPVDKGIFIRISASDKQRLDDLVERIPVAGKTAIAREAMRIGLAAIEKDPTVLIRAELPKKGGARKRTKKRRSG